MEIEQCYARSRLLEGENRCDAGAVVLVASAVARQKGKTGSNYRGLNLASFRGSSELEYGCDSAFLLEPDEVDEIAFRC